MQHLTVHEHILWVRRFAADPLSTEACDALIEAFEIEPLMQQTPASLSGGEKQRVALLCALVKKSRWILLDEPLVGIGNKMKNTILACLKDYAATYKTPMLFISHHINEVVALADHLLLLNKGSVLASGPVTDVLNAYQPDYGVISGRYRFYDAEVTHWQNGICQVVTQGVSLKLLTSKKNPGDTLRFRLLAKDISLALAPTESSILNVLKADVKSIEHLEDAYRICVTLQRASALFVAEISLESFKKLALAQGMSVYMQIKASAIE